LQTLPEQQAFPSVPQVWQVSAPPEEVVWHDRPVVHSSTLPPLLLQQIRADEPQGMQCPVVVSQRVPGAVQVEPPPVQQIWPLPPHIVPPVVTHVPPMQVPLLLPQVVFAATQVPRTQQPLPLQVLAPQQFWFGSPHVGAPPAPAAPAAPPAPA
jgi:hypothetical protein